MPIKRKRVKPWVAIHRAAGKTVKPKKRNILKDFGKLITSPAKNVKNIVSGVKSIKSRKTKPLSQCKANTKKSNTKRRIRINKRRRKGLQLLKKSKSGTRNLC